MEESKRLYEVWNEEYYSSQYNRYLYDLKLIETYFSEGKILEVGSVPCHFTKMLKDKGFDFVSVDFYPEREKDFIEENNLPIIKHDLEKGRLPFEDNTFSLILFNEIFEHLRFNPIETLKELRRVLKDDGLMMLTTPNLYFIKNIILFNIGRGIKNPYREFSFIGSLGCMGHIREYSRREVKDFLDNTGFKIIHHEYKFYNWEVGKKFFLNPFFIIPFFKPFQIFIIKKNDTIKKEEGTK